MMYGEEVTINVYEPATDEDMDKGEEALETDVEEFSDEYGVDLFDTYTDADEMWRKTLDDDWGSDHE